MFHKLNALFGAGVVAAATAIAAVTASAADATSNNLHGKSTTAAIFTAGRQLDVGFKWDRGEDVTSQPVGLLLKKTFAINTAAAQ